MLYVLAVLTFFIVFALVLLIYLGAVESKRSVGSRLRTLQEVRMGDEEDEPLSLPFRIRILKPLITRTIAFFNRLLPANLVASVEQKLIQGGNPKGLKAGVFIPSVIVAALILAAVVFILLNVFHLGLVKAFLWAIVVLVFFLLASFLWLYMTVDKRIKAIELALPDAIDLLVVSVEAGLGFDLALAKVAERMKGPLADEFTKALSEMNLGKARQESLRDLSRRVESPGLSSFLSMVIQGTQMGVTMGTILRIQSETMRRIRRQKVEEMSMKAPIKMVFPLVLCIFPALLIVILGPAILSFMKAF